MVQTGSSGGDSAGAIGRLGMDSKCAQQCRLASVDGTVSFLKFKGTARQGGPKK